MRLRHLVPPGLVLLGASLPAVGPSTKILQLTGGRRVLFVGNSLTYHNDLPATVRSLARTAGDTALRTASIAEPDFSLEDHYLTGTVQEALECSMRTLP